MTTPSEQGAAALAPCPFCGTHPAVKAVARDWWKLLIDHRDGCMLSGHLDDVIAPQDDESKAALISMWNRRASLPSSEGAGAPVRVYLVATGETHNGQETYTRHDKPVPLADQEVLYSAPQDHFVDANKMVPAAPVVEPGAQAGREAEDAEKALDLLAVLFTAYENGPACYEDPDDCAGFLGNAVRLSDEDFHKCADLLNRRRPVAARATQGDRT